METYPFDDITYEDPFEMFQTNDLPPPFTKPDGDYCIYVRDKRTGKLQTICESDLPF